MSGGRIDRGLRCSLRSCSWRSSGSAHAVCRSPNASAPMPSRFCSTGSELVIHLVDPHVFDGGQVWRSTQDRVLLMNTVASQVTLFVDDTVDCAGPVVTGPSLYEWARSIALVGSPNVPEAVRAEAAALGPDDYPSRPFYGSYLQWARDRIIWTAPPAVSFTSHQATAVDVRDTLGWLAGSRTGHRGDHRRPAGRGARARSHAASSRRVRGGPEPVRGPARPAVYRTEQPGRRAAGRHTRGRIGDLARHGPQLLRLHGAVHHRPGRRVRARGPKTARPL